MEHVIGLLKVRVVRGINLVRRDSSAGDPYVLVTMANQILKTSAKKNSLNPEWNEDLTLSVEDHTTPIKIQVLDKDTFTKDDPMGEAEVHIQPLVDAVKMNKIDFPNDGVIKEVAPSSDNFLARESYISLKDGVLTQDLVLKLRNVECGELELRLQWVSIPGSKDF